MTTRILFWNTQRLGGSTDVVRASIINGVANGAKADVELFCELTTTCATPEPRNLTYRKKGAMQLCYGAREGDDDIELTKEDCTATAEWLAANFKGKSNFEKLCSRALATIGKYGGAEIYCFHAPASHMAIKAVSYVGCYLDAKHDVAPWALIGDLNVPPDKLAAVRTALNMKDLIRRSGQPTHKKGKELDYVLSNMDHLTVTREDVDLTTAGSDHYPIVMQY